MQTQVVKDLFPSQSFKGKTMMVPTKWLDPKAMSFYPSPTEIARFAMTSPDAIRACCFSESFIAYNYVFTLPQCLKVGHQKY